MKGLIGRHVELTGKVLDMRMKRQNVVMSNLANLRTPGYKPLKVEFEDQLQSALNLDKKGKMTRSEAGHMPSVFDPEGFGPEWDKEFQPRVVHGDDNVDLDKEMATMAKNTMMYNALTTVLKKNFDGMNKIISEGSR